MAKFKRGESGNPEGRPKGTPNKLTVELKQALLEPFESASFTKWAKKKQDAYYTLILTKLIPKDVNMRVIGGLADLTEEERACVFRDIIEKGKKQGILPGGKAKAEGV